MLASTTKIGSLNKSQFTLLFDIAPTNERIHCQTGRHIEKGQDCLCGIDAKRSNDVGCMDITLINLLAHTPGIRISEPDFNSQWDETEKAILGIANTVGTYFAKTIKRKIDKSKQAELSIEQIKEIIESNAGDVKKNFLFLFETQRKENAALVKNAKDEIIEHITKAADKLSTKIGNTRFDIKEYTKPSSNCYQQESFTTQGQVNSMDTTVCVSDVQIPENDKNVRKCRVEWRLETPETWNLKEMKETLVKFSALLRPYFEIEFVYIDLWL
ncbi:unnamed protein product [Mytilus edulis]|uniref:Uncharacterized protein n=1 Tax=Mytilus edulis TaxID=6550 RepID=A0A8S3UHQ5_MYTED|nr:unnamed protein product [Mytilus edulis]